MELKLYTEAEAAEILRMKKDTLRKKRLAGKIRAIKDGGIILYSAAQIQDYLDRNTTGAAA